MEIILYTTHCPQCIMLENLMKSKNIKYTVNENIQDMEKLGIKSVPCLNVDGVVMNFKDSLCYIRNI